jgi:hypothetical protein
MEEVINDLDGVLLSRFSDDMNEQIPVKETEESITAFMPTAYSPAPANLKDCVILAIEEPCSSDDVYRITCDRPWIKKVSVSNRTYSRQEIANMGLGTRLGGVDYDTLQVPTPTGDGGPIFTEPVRPPLQGEWQPQTTATQRNIFRRLDEEQGLAVPVTTAAAPQYYTTERMATRTDAAYREYIERLMRENPAWNNIPAPTMGVYEQLQQTAREVPAASLDMEQLFNTARRIQQEREQRTTAGSGVSITNQDAYYQ